MASDEQSTTVPQIVVEFREYQIADFEERVIQAAAAHLYGALVGKLTERVEAKMRRAIEEWTAKTIIEEIQIPRLRKAGSDRFSDNPEPDGTLDYQDAQSYTAEAEGKTIHEHLTDFLLEWRKSLQTNTLADNRFNRTNALSAIADRYLRRSFDYEIQKAAREAADEVKKLARRKLDKAVAAEASKLVKGLAK